jgi:rsbT co-antagonist protein RsbR
MFAHNQGQDVISDDAAGQAERLGQFSTWFLITVFSVGITTLLGYLATSILLLALISSIGLTLSVTTLVTRWALARGRVVVAATILFVAVQMAVLAVAVVFPLMLPVSIAGVLMAIALILPYVGRGALRLLMVIACAVGLVAAVLTRLPLIQNLFPAPPAWIGDLVLISIMPLPLALTALLLWQFSSRLTETLSQTRSANAALRQSQAELESRVVERTSDLRAALDEVAARAAEQARLLEANEQQRTTIRELSVPVLPISAGTLVMPLIGALDTARLQLFRDQALRAIEREHARTLVLDITGVPVVDSQVAQGLLGVVQAARLLGAEVALVGIRPEVAQAIVTLGLTLTDLRTYGDLQSAFGAVTRMNGGIRDWRLEIRD